MRQAIAAHSNCGFAISPVTAYNFINNEWLFSLPSNERVVNFFRPVYTENQSKTIIFKNLDSFLSLIREHPVFKTIY